MLYDEGYEGFVPIVALLPDQRVEGKVWKKAGRRLLEHIEHDGRRFLPIVEAEVSGPSPGGHRVGVLPVVALNVADVRAIIPGDSVTPTDQKPEVQTAERASQEPSERHATKRA